MSTTDTPAAPPKLGKRDVWLVFWIFPAFYTFFGVVFVPLGRVIPPPRPDTTPEQVVQFFTAHATVIQIGFALLLLVFGGAGVSNGLVGYHMKRMTSGPVLAYGYMGAMSVGVLPSLMLVGFCFLTAVFRPDRNAELQMMLYDLGLMSFIGALGCFSTAYVCLAVAILYDKNEIFPKWFAYVTVWQIVSLVMLVLVFVSKAGAFAWNGAFFWEGIVLFGIWLTALILSLRSATAREPADAVSPD